MRLLFRLVAVLLPLLAFGTLPRAASALPGFDYCSGVDWGGDRFPDGDCDALLTVPIAWRGQTTQLTLRIENETRGRLSRSRVAELRRMLPEVAGGVGPAFGRLNPLLLPETVTLVIVNDSIGAEVHAETVRRSTGDGSDCPIMLYNGGAMEVGALARTIAHEIFHCAQYRTVPGKVGGGELPRWWMEGSAEWFEDLALPHLQSSSDLAMAVTTFRDRSATTSLLDLRYGNVVLFSWLGPRRVPDFILAMANDGEDQLAGARRALPDSEWLRFARDYADEHIATPGGLPVAGEYGPQWVELHRTTGVVGERPHESGEYRPLTLVHGSVWFVPAHYRPNGTFGTQGDLFSERVGTWGLLPTPLDVTCGGERKFRMVGIGTRPMRLRIAPGTYRAEPRDCGCPVGSWTINEGDLEESYRPGPEWTLLTHGSVFMQFNADGTAHFKALGMRFRGPTREVGTMVTTNEMTRDKEYFLTWRKVGGELTFAKTRPSLTRDTTTTTIRSPVLNTTQTKPSRWREDETDNFAGKSMAFTCSGNTLIIREPGKGLDASTAGNRKRRVWYPWYGTYVRM